MRQVETASHLLLTDLLLSPPVVQAGRQSRAATRKLVVLHSVASSPGLPRLFIAAPEAATKSLGRPGDKATIVCVNGPVQAMAYTCTVWLHANACTGMYMYMCSTKVCSFNSLFNAGMAGSIG